MATAIATVNKPTSELGEKLMNAFGTISVAAGDYATGGLTLNFKGKIHSSRKLIWLSISGLSGYRYLADLGSDLSNAKLKILDNTGVAADGPQIEYTNAAALNAAITGDTIRYHALFKESL